MLAVSFALSATAGTGDLRESAGSGAARVERIGADTTAELPTLRTVIDTENPAAVSGSTQTVALYWVAGDRCTPAVKLKFFRREGETLHLTGERGPFDLTASRLCGNGVPENVPPGTVVREYCFSTWRGDEFPELREGDLIGVTRLNDCGSPFVRDGGPYFGPGEYLQYSGDVTEAVPLADGIFQTGRLQIRAHATVSEWTAAILPLVASGSGLRGSLWRTSLELVNPDESQPIEGRLVFRGAANAARPPSELPFKLEAAEAMTIPDLVASFGATGAGSVDVVVTFGATPQVAAHVFNDDGEGGTHGLLQAGVSPTAGGVGCWDQPDYPGTPTLGPGVSGFLITPESPTEERFSIGVRSMSMGATIEASLRDRGGDLLHTTTRSYPPNHFEQVAAEQFLGAPIGATQSIRLRVVRGRAIVYGTTTDNRTNDPSMQQVLGEIYDSGPDTTPVPLSAREVVLRILPVVGPPEKGTGAGWRTSVQLFNPHPRTIKGTLRFHRTRSDWNRYPSMALSLAPGQIVTFADVVAAVGGIGHGYVTFSGKWREPAPLILARAHGESEDGGTRGATLRAVDPITWWGCPTQSGFDPERRMYGSDSFLVPSSRERLTIGFVGAPSAGISFSAVLKDVNGSTVKTARIDRPSGWSEEIAVEDLFGTSIDESQSISFVGNGGAALIYGVTTDLRTGDIRIQYVGPGGWYNL